MPSFARRSDHQLRPNGARMTGASKASDWTPMNRSPLCRSGMAKHEAAAHRRLWSSHSRRPTDTVLGSDGSGRALRISDIAWDACGQSQLSRAGGDRRPSGTRTATFQCRHAADAAAAALTTDKARALLSIKKRRTS
jgi:hypothetical protein